MEDKDIKMVFGSILLVIGSIVLLSIIFLVKKYTKKDPVQPDNNLNLTYIKCNKNEYIEDEKYNSYTEFELSYNNSDLYEYKTTIKYTTDYEYKDKLKTTLETMKDTETKLFSSGISGSFKIVNGGGETTLTYSLSDSTIRSHVNTKYFKGNLYKSKNDLVDYFTSKNYKCDNEIKIG